ncbi:MAG: AAA family ATPase, partial [Chloroflexi bacterium]|nr:AAA family ATPase [Chloroflexota bacterium]
RARGSAGDALRWLDRVLEGDPLDEEALELALRSLLDGGREADALRRYRRFEQLLLDELGVPPGPALREVAAEVRAGGRAPSAPAGDTRPARRARTTPVVPAYLRRAEGPFVGREAEVVHAIAPVVAGSVDGPRLVLLTADAGMGKTRTLGEMARRARAAGALTLAGGCYEQEGGLPYGPIRDALLDYVGSQSTEVLRADLDGLAAEVAEIVPEVRRRLGAPVESRDDGGGRRLHLFTSVADLLSRITRDQTLVLLLDDLHWADAISLQLLHFLLRQDQLRHVLMVGAYRDDGGATDSPLASLVSEAGRAGTRTEVIPLPPLGEADMAALLTEELRGSCAGSLVKTLHQRSGGNPFFALQMLALLRDQGQLERRADGWRAAISASVTLPLAVRETVRRRLRRLGRDEATVLRLGAVLGQAFGYAPLEALWDGEERDLYSALESLIEAGLLRQTEEGYAFPQPLVQEVVYQGLPLYPRRRLHRRAGLALERVYGRDAEAHIAAIAHQFVEGEDAERAVPYAERAGDQAEAAYAYDQAERWYRAALELMRAPAVPGGARGQREAGLLFKLGKVLRFGPHREDAVSALKAAAALFRTRGDRIAEARALATLAKTYARGGAGREAAEILSGIEPLLASLEREPPSRDLASLYGELALLDFRLGRYRDLLSIREREVIIAGALDDERLLLRAIAGRAVALSLLGCPREAGRVAAGLIEPAEALGDVETLRLALAQAAEAAMVAGDFSRSRAYRERELVAAERMPGPAARPFTLANLAQLRVYLGDWEAARHDATRALEELLSVGSEARAMYPRLFLGEIALREGKGDEASRRLEECAATAGQVGDSQALRYAQRLLAEREIEEGRPGSARERLMPLLDRPGLEEHDVTFLLPVLAWALLEAGDVVLGARVAQEALTRAISQENRLAQVDGLRVYGMALTRQGRWGEARLATGEAVAVAAGMPYPYAEGRALVERGTASTGAGDIASARADLCHALAIFRSLGAVKDIERAERVLTGPAGARESAS